MRKLISILLASVFVCAFAVLPLSAADIDDGFVCYRQSFSDVSTPAAAGVVKGTKNAGTFSLSVKNDALSIDTYGEEKAYVILPFYNTLEDYTVSLSFSVENIRKDNAYLALMLTSGGIEPNNIESVTVRASGECDGFGTLDSSLVKLMNDGEILNMKVYVKGDVPVKLELSCKETVSEIGIQNIFDVVEGNIGFVVRNVSARIYDVAVIKGTDFESCSGALADSSLWTDEAPYNANSSASQSPECGGIYSVPAPDTGDGFVMLLMLSVASLVFVFRKRRTI